MATEKVKIKFEAVGLNEMIAQVKTLVRFANQAVKLQRKLAKKENKKTSKT